VTRRPLLLLDADLLIAHLRRKPEADRWLLAHPPATLAISAVTLFEIEGGVYLTRDPDLERRNIGRVLGVIALLPFDAEAARQAAGVRAALERTGSPIGPYDTLLAGHAVALRAGVATENLREFKRVKGLHVEPWRMTSMGS
jgi:tRNA(fMet)-specific endonuclease VapC